MLFGGQTVSFESAYGVEESVRHLSAIVARWPFKPLLRQSLIGRVTENNVFLMRSIPLVSNWCAPALYGAFQIREGVTVLEGKFMMNHWGRIFWTIWFSGVALCVLILPIVSLNNWQNWPWQTRLLLPLLPIGMMIWGLVLLKAFQWLARNDVAYTSERIHSVLQPGDVP